MTYANSSAPRFDLGSFLILFSVAPFRAPRFQIGGQLVASCVGTIDGYPGPPSFGATRSHLT